MEKEEKREKQHQEMTSCPLGLSCHRHYIDQTLHDQNHERLSEESKVLETYVRTKYIIWKSKNIFVDLFTSIYVYI